MKHLKIAVISTPITNAIQILDQTHRGKDFGPINVACGSQFVASNGITLCSDASPEFSQSAMTLYVRGEYEDSDDAFIPINKLEDLDKIIDAVMEYNSYFANTNLTNNPNTVTIIG